LKSVHWTTDFIKFMLLR